MNARLIFSCFLMALGMGCRPAAPGSSRAFSNQIFERVEIIGSRGTALGQFNKPRSLAVDRQDNLYVVDMTGRVQKFSPRGEFLLSWQMPETDLGKPKGMACDGQGNIVVIEPHYSRVNHFRPDGTLLDQWGTKGTNAGEFSLPRAVAVNTRGDLFISEYTRAERVQCFDAAHQHLLFSIGTAGAGPGEFNRPEGLAIDATGRLYVADSCNHRIQIFSPQGEWLESYGRPGPGPGELSYPYDIRIDAQGRQYVCEFGNSRIQVFDVNHQSVEILGDAGWAPGQFSNPWSIALDSQGNLYVADAGNHRVQKFVRKRPGAKITTGESTAPAADALSPSLESARMAYPLHLKALLTNRPHGGLRGFLRFILMSPA